jgi:hypothetical protein
LLTSPFAHRVLIFYLPILEISPFFPHPFIPLIAQVNWAVSSLLSARTVIRALLHLFLGAARRRRDAGVPLRALRVFFHSS